MPFDASQIAVPFRMQPGLRRAAPGRAPLTSAHPNGRHFREKMAVLSSFSDQALVAEDGFDARPALHVLACEASLMSPPAFSFEAAGDTWRAPGLGWSVCGNRIEGDGDGAVGALLRALAPSQRPAALLSLAFEEDFAIIDASARIPWLAVCLPSRWAPEDKVGRHFAEVHGPVADNAMLVAAGDHLARLVTGAERWERSVWTISAEPRLHQHPDRRGASWPDPADADALAANASFRHERQGFIPVAGTGQAVFTIRVGSEPLDRAIATADMAQRVHDALASMSPAVLTYRGLDGARDRLLAWLAARRDALSLQSRHPSP